MTKRVDMLIHEINYSGLPNFGIMLANALLDANIPVRLLVLGEETKIPFVTNPKLEIKFFGIKRSPKIVGKILYLIRVFFILSVYLARSQSRHIFTLGKEYMGLLVLMRDLLPLPYKLGGFNDSNIPLHIKNNVPAPLKPVLNYFYKFTLKKADYIISQSDAMARDLNEIYGVAIDKITTIPPIIDKKFFESPALEKPKTNHILFVGKLADYKQPFKIIEIFRKLENKNATLEFVGDGELAGALQEKAFDPEIGSRIKLSGSQNDTLPFIRKADVVILASKYEGLPMVLVEAIASGIPVVSFDCPTGPSEIIIDGVNGYLIPQDDIELFARKLDAALNKDWDHKKIAETSEKFHPDAVIKRHIGVVRGVA